MIKINVDTSQKELINSLTQNLNETGELYMQVASLPYFLSSIPSIKVFQYKINNYPRPLFWYSTDHKILTFLKQSDLPISFPATLISTSSSPIKETAGHTFNNIFKETSTPLNTTVLGAIKQEDKPNLTFEPETLGLKIVETKPANIPAPKHIEYQPQAIEEMFGDRAFETTFEPTFAQSYEAPAQVDTQSFLSKIKDNFEPKSDLYSTKAVSNSAQDFDSMIGRLEKTKNKVTKDKINLVSDIKFSFLDFFKKYKLQFNSALSLGLILLLVGVFNIFPKNILNVEVSSELDQKTIEVRIPESQLKKTIVELKSTSQIQTTPISLKPETATTSTKVKLINNSTGTVSFDKGGIILISEKNGQEYRQKSIAADKSNYAVSPGEENIYINIQPTKIGGDLPPKNSVLKVFNLNGDALGFNFKAVVQDASFDTASNFNSFSVSDKDSLKTKIESDLTEKRASFINSLNDNNNFTSPSWFNVISSDITYDKEINDVADSVNAQAITKIEVYSIPKVQFRNTIQIKSNLTNISDMQVIDTKIEEGKEKLINTTFLITYENGKKIPTNEIASKLYNGEKTKVQEQYPNIKRISTEFKPGIAVPGISPVNSINIQEKNSK